MPVLMRLQRMLEPNPLAGRFPFPARQQSRASQHPPNTGRTYRHHLGIEHHESQPSIALQRMLPMELDNRSFLPVLQPEVPRDPAVVFVHPPITLPPVVELAGPNSQPSDESGNADLALL